MVSIIGQKLGMTTIYDSEGNSVPCTVIRSKDCVVTQLKTNEKDGYSAVQLAYGDKKEKNTNLSLLGHFKAAKTTAKQFVTEIRDFEIDVQLGDILDISTMFLEGDFVNVIGKSKGKGFQGVVKRHGFGGVGSRTHGQHNRERAPGSVGASSYPSRVFKGLRMAGRTGDKRVKVSNLKILKIINDKNLFIINGCVPGGKNSFVVIEKAI